MANEGLLRALGVVVMDEVLSPDRCRELVNEQATWRDATVGGDQRVVVHEIRRTLKTKLAPEGQAVVDELLDDLRPRLEAHFARELGTFERPQLLRYEPGNYFRVHTDSGEGDVASGRSVSISLFLNDHGTDYDGGALRFYGLMTGPDGRQAAIPIQGRAGRLVAFRSDLAHEVEAVTRGSRFTIVTWFQAAVLAAAAPASVP